jgi:hypothetical protein
MTARTPGRQQEVVVRRRLVGGAGEVRRGAGLDPAGDDLALLAGPVLQGPGERAGGADDRPGGVAGPAAQGSAVHAGQGQGALHHAGVDLVRLGERGQADGDPGEPLGQARRRQSAGSPDAVPERRRSTGEDVEHVRRERFGRLDVDGPDHLAVHPHRHAGLAEQPGHGRDEAVVTGHVLLEDGHAGLHDPTDDTGPHGEAVHHLEVAPRGLAAQPPVDEQVDARQRVALTQVVHELLAGADHRRGSRVRRPSRS